VEFDQLGATIQIIDLTAAGSTDPDGLGYSPATETLLLGEDIGDAIIEVDMSGNPLNVWDMSGLGISPEGVGMDMATGNVFIADGFGNMVHEIAGMFSLGVDTLSIKETGGKANFVLNALSSNASRDYILLGSITGTSPGTPLPKGMATLPLNIDIFTNIVFQYMNTPIFDKFLGTLDAQGMATATLDVPIATGAAGLKMHFAFALNKPWNFASTTAYVEIVP